MYLHYLRKHDRSHALITRSYEFCRINLDILIFRSCMKKYNTVTILDLHTLKILNLVHKFSFHKNKLPEIFTSYFDENQSHYNYNSRGKNSLHIIRCNTTYGLKSIKYKGPKLWNELPTQLKTYISTKMFRGQFVHDPLKFFEEGRDQGRMSA